MEKQRLKVNKLPQNDSKPDLTAKTRLCMLNARLCMQNGGRNDRSTLSNNNSLSYKIQKECLALFHHDKPLLAKFDRATTPGLTVAQTAKNKQ